MNCPHCRSVELLRRKHKASNVSLDCCPRCHGVWFDVTELERVLEVAARDLQPLASAAPLGRRCPRCDRSMSCFQYPQTPVSVDMCPTCSGVWLDGPEFNEIKALRERLREEGRLDVCAPVPGVKGKLLRLIDLAIRGLLRKLWRSPDEPAKALTRDDKEVMRHL